MVTLVSVTPILPVRDFEGALERYSRIGFEVTRYTGDALYAYADRDQVNLHLIHSTSHNPKTSSVMVYLYVDDADALYSEWAAADLGGHLHPVTDTDYGLREGAYGDPDGNLLRFGSPCAHHEGRCATPGP